MKKRQDLINVWHKPVVKVHHAEETLEIHLADWEDHITNGLNFRTERHNTSLRDSVVEELQRGDAKDTFLAIDGQPCGNQLP